MLPKKSILLIILSTAIINIEIKSSNPYYSPAIASNRSVFSPLSKYLDNRLFLTACLFAIGCTVWKLWKSIDSDINLPNNPIIPDFNNNDHVFNPGFTVGFTPDKPIDHHSEHHKYTHSISKGDNKLSPNTIPTHNSLSSTPNPYFAPIHPVHEAPKKTIPATDLGLINTAPRHDISAMIDFADLERGYKESKLEKESKAEIGKTEFRELRLKSDSSDETYPAIASGKVMKTDELIDTDGMAFLASQIQKLNEIFISKNYKLLAELLNIDITKHAEGPFIFEQIFIENFAALKRLLNLYNDLTTKYTNSEDLIRITKGKLIKVYKQVEDTYINGPWYKGRIVVNSLLNGESIDIFKKTSEMHIHSIAYIAWYLYELAINKNQAFIEGTFNVEYKPIFDFMISYQYAYDRSGHLKSSHYHEINHPKYGINIPINLREELSFPNNKAHLLLGNISLDHNPIFIFFIKPESYPTENPEPVEGAHHNLDLLHHGLEYGVALGRKFGIGSDDESYMRKERIPKNIFEAFEHLYYAYFPEQKPNFIMNNRVISRIYDSRPAEIILAEKFGIKSMLSTVRKYLSFGTTQEQDQASNIFFELLRSLDHLNLRKGREVILTVEEIQRDLVRKLE